MDSFIVVKIRSSNDQYFDSVCLKKKRERWDNWALMKHFFSTSVKIYFVKKFIFVFYSVLFLCHINICCLRMMFVELMS